MGWSRFHASSDAYAKLQWLESGWRSWLALQQTNGHVNPAELRLARPLDAMRTALSTVPLWRQTHARIQSFKKLQHARLSSAWDICKAFASYVFGHHRVERRLTNRTKPLNIGDKLMMRFRIFQATLSPHHPTSAFWHPTHLQSLVQPVDSICHALCQWWQGTCHLATGQSGYACKHPVVRPWVQITCYCDF